MPRVSVIIPTYNRAAVIGRTIDSALAQTYPNIEVIVVDDGSTDDTRNLLSHYDERVRYVYEENAGPATARNRGLGLSDAEFVTFLDSDDTLLPTKLEKQIAYLTAHPDIDIALCGWSVFDRDRQVLTMEVPAVPADDILRAILLMGSYGLFPPEVPLLRRACLARTPGFDVSLPAREEQDFWLQAALSGCRFGLVKGVLCTFIDASDSRGKNEANVERAMPVILNKVFSHPALPPQIAGLKDEVYARVEIQFGYYHLSMCRSEGDPEMDIAKEHLAEALALHPSRDAWAQRYLDLIAHQASALCLDGGAGACLRRMLDRLFPQPARPAWLESDLYARLHAELAFQAYEAGRYADVPRHALEAIWRRPRLILDRGLPSVLLKSLAGKGRPSGSSRPADTEE